MEIYNKRGPLSPKEKKLVRKLKRAIEEKVAADPEFQKTFTPANSFEDLEKLHDTHCITDIEHIEIKPDAPDKELESILEGNSDSAPKPTIDPFNAEEPITRDYVNEEGFSSNPANDKNNQQGQTSFAEPTNFKESFEMPSDDSQQDSDSKSSFGSDKAKTPKQEPVNNPAFDAMNTAARNRKTRKMAKNIISGFCILLSEGVPFLATKDITPEALAAAAKRKQIDLSMLLSFDGETQIHIVDYFKQMCEQAKSLGTIPDDLKEELIDALYEVLLEKKITPTPMQSLMMSMGEVALHIGLKTIAFRMQISSVKAVAAPNPKGSFGQPTYQGPHYEPKAPPAKENTSAKNNKEPEFGEDKKQSSAEYFDNVAEQAKSLPLELAEIGDKIETKE